MRSSVAAFNLVVREEIGSKELYEQKYQRPEWPGVASGPTVGIGYDLGQTSAKVIRADWKGRVTDQMLEAMVSVSGKTGRDGQAATAKIKNLVKIPWDTAIDVHKERVLPRWEDKVTEYLPNCRELSGDSFGALVSLTFNRGPSFNNQGDRYREMRAIKQHMKDMEFNKIPAELRSMKRLWPDTKALVNRREREAVLFEKGLDQPSAEIVTTLNRQVKGVQSRLLQLNYPPGEIDGLWGGRTAGAIAAFLNDRHSDVKAPTSSKEFSEAFSDISAELTEAETEKFTRPISAERREATPEELAPKLPEVAAARNVERITFWTSLASGLTAAITGISKALGEAVEWLNPLRTIATEIPWFIWVIGALAISGSIYYISRKAGEAKQAAVEAYQEGKRV